jgi:hypothetical protein
LEGIQDRKMRIRHEGHVPLCKRHEEIPTGIDNICIRIPSVSLTGRISAAEEQNFENYLPDRSYAETQNEIENYELQEQRQHPYRIQREPDLRKEQEEYFRRIPVNAV